MSAELRTENKDVKTSMADMQKRVDEVAWKLAEQTPRGSSHSDTLIEMKKLVDEYKAKAQNFDNNVQTAPSFAIQFYSTSNRLSGIRQRTYHQFPHQS